MRRVTRSNRLASQRVDDEMLIISSDSNKLTILNDTGARVWELLETERTVDDIVRIICAEFECDLARVEADVETFLADLERRGHVVRSAEGRR